MTRTPLPIEEQLRRYADAIDPALTTDPAPNAPGERRAAGWLRSPALLAAAAAAVAIALLGSLAFRHEPTQQVETTDFAGQNEQPAPPDVTAVPAPDLAVADDAVLVHIVEPGDILSRVAERYGVTVEAILIANADLNPNVLLIGQELLIPPPGPSSPVDQVAEPIYWPHGSTGPRETVFAFLDQWFPEAAELELQAPQDPVVLGENRVEVTLLRRDGSVFATVPMRFGDGRWFLDEIRSPLFDLGMTGAEGATSGEIKAAAPGAVTIDLVYMYDAAVVASTTVEVADSQLGEWQPVRFEVQHQHVNASLVSPTGELLGVVAFTVPFAPPAGFDPLDIADESHGFWVDREDSLSIVMAEHALLGECMGRAGRSFPQPTIDEYVLHAGEWRANGVLGIGRRAAAATLGYRSAGWGGAGSPSQAAAWNATPPDTDALRACWDDVHATFGFDQTRWAELWNELIGADGTQGERWRSEPTLGAAISSWQECMRVSIGVEADTPNELARRYIESGAEVTDEERSVALADVACQQTAGLEQAFFLAQSRGIADELGDQVHLWNELAEINWKRIVTAREVLADRGIEPPSLD